MSNTPQKLQVFLTLLNIQAVPYGVHERNTIGYLVAFESRRAAAIAVAAAAHCSESQQKVQKVL